jgi:hypothetical protein
MFAKINLLFVAYPKSAFALFRHKTKFFPFSQLQKVFCDEQKPSFTFLSLFLSLGATSHNHLRYKKLKKNDV